MLHRLVPLVGAFLARDLRTRWRGSVLPGWGLLLPLGLLAISAGVFGAIFRVRFPEGGYWLPVLCGMLPWLAVQEASRRSAGCLVENAAAVRNVRFPAQAIPLALAAQAVLLEAVGLLAAVPWLLPSAGWEGVAGALALLPLQLLFVAGLSLLLSALQVFVRDVTPALAVILPAWFYLSPILYPVAQAPDRLRPLLSLNPLAQVMEAHRDLLVRGAAPRALDVALYAAWAALLFAAGWLVFRRLSPRLGDEL